MYKKRITAILIIAIIATVISVFLRFVFGMTAHSIMGIKVRFIDFTLPTHGIDGKNYSTSLYYIASMIFFLLRSVIAIISAFLIFDKVYDKKNGQTEKGKLIACVFAVSLMLASFFVEEYIFGLSAPICILADFLIFFVAASFYIKESPNILKEEGFRDIEVDSMHVMNENSYNSNSAEKQQADSYSKVSGIPNEDELRETILGAIKPSLKAPLTAVLCGTNEMLIHVKDNTYIIEGYVNSQNSYGAMLATDFTVSAIYSNDRWSIVESNVGEKTARNNAKNFISNYILLSIFVTAMGFIGYFILSSLF